MKLSDFDFRVWDNDEKCFLDPYTKSRAVVKNLPNEKLLNLEIELFTGLYDKKGKKVYENDIVKVKSLYDYFLAKISIHKEGTFYFEGKNGDYIGSLIYLVEDEGYTIETIGNIHENAELLNK
ncbi:hypothetical protein GZ494_001733 [Campylobacter jejuni]|nr:hypothetical protein [Campylobacter jejuni]EKJ5775057.1 hypothetical protein [Campylobacter coli]